MERMTSIEKELLISLINKYWVIIENKSTDSETQLEKLRCWRTIEDEFNGNSRVVKRNWKQLRKAWDNVKTKRRKTQAQETQRRLATGGGPYAPPVCDPNPEWEIVIPSLSQCEQNVGDMDDDGMDSPPIPNGSSGNTEVLLECPTFEAPPSDVPCAATVMGGPTPSSSGGMTRGAAIEREFQGRLEGLKSYNEKRDKVQALRQETAGVELATATLAHELQLQRMKRESEMHDLQLEILRLQRKQQEQSLAHRKKMDVLEIEIKEQELRQMLDFSTRPSTSYSPPLPTHTPPPNPTSSSPPPLPTQSPPSYPTSSFPPPLPTLDPPSTSTSSSPPLLHTPAPSLTPNSSSPPPIRTPAPPSMKKNMKTLRGGTEAELASERLLKIERRKLEEKEKRRRLKEEELQLKRRKLEIEERRLTMDETKLEGQEEIIDIFKKKLEKINK